MEQSNESDRYDLQERYEDIVAENNRLKSALSALHLEVERNSKEYSNHIAIARIENKQLNSLVSNLQDSLQKTKIAVTNAERSISEKSQIVENLRALIEQKDEERIQIMVELDNARVDNHRVNTLLQEKEEYIEILSARLSEEADLSAKLQKELDITILHHETIVSSLEETALLLENDIRLINKKMEKELEKSKLEKLNLTVKLQVHLCHVMCSHDDAVIHRIGGNGSAIRA